MVHLFSLHRLAKTTIEKSEISPVIPQQISGIEQAMKTKPKSILSLLCLLALTSFFTGCGETVISEDQKQERSDGLVYKPNSEIPFTGVVEDHYDNGQKYSEWRYKNGILHGQYVVWHRNGQKREVGSFRNGKRVGLRIAWYSDGEKNAEIIYEDGEIKEKTVY